MDLFHCQMETCTHTHTHTHTQTHTETYTHTHTHTHTHTLTKVSIWQPVCKHTHTHTHKQPVQLNCSRQDTVSVSSYNPVSMQMMQTGRSIKRSESQTPTE